MYDDGYTEIMNVDVSQNAVEQMLERSKETRPNLKYKTADITDMTECFEDKSYDVILDKGTLDTMLCYEKPTVIGAKVLKEVQRVLKPGGTYISISFASPDIRLKTLQQNFLQFDIRCFMLYYSDRKEIEN